jgi:hypothetical protein
MFPSADQEDLGQMVEASIKDADAADDTLRNSRRVIGTFMKDIFFIDIIYLLFFMEMPIS